MIKGKDYCSIDKPSSKASFISRQPLCEKSGAIALALLGLMVGCQVGR